MTSRFAVAKEHVLASLDALVPELFGSGPRNSVRSSGAWHVASPGSGSKPDQMVIWRTGTRRGGWKDFVTGAQGDAIDLIAYVNEGIIHADSRMRAVAWIEEKFGIRHMEPAARAAMEANAARRREQQEARDATRLDTARERSRKAFFAAAPGLLGTPVEIYLRSRGIDLREVPNLSSDFRFRADAEWWMGAARDDKGDKLAPGPKFPALVSAMRSGDGTLCALHYTFLAPDGRGKAPVDKPKLMWPDTAGLTIRVTHGPSGLNCEDAGARAITGILGTTEGIEDALSAAIAQRGELRLQAAGSLAGLLSMPDLACASAHLVFRDNDWSKPQATALFEQAMARIRGFGKPTEVVAMPTDWGKDVNDALRG